MIVTLICEERLYSVTLPEKARGQFWLENDRLDLNDVNRRFFGIEAEDGQWVIRSNKRLQLFVIRNNDPQQTIVLEENKLYLAVMGKNHDVKGYIFTEAYTVDRCTYTKYQILSETSLSIGSQQSNSIVINNPYVSGTHAVLTCHGGDWTIQDNNSSNGVYVNSNRIRGGANLKAGDVVYILGFKIVAGRGFIAINNPDKSVSIRTDQLAKLILPAVTSYEAPEEEQDKYYYRSPRFHRTLNTLELVIDGPTAPEDIEATPMVLAIGPSLVMGCASFASGVVSTTNTIINSGKILSAVPSMIMSVSMLSGMIIFPFIIKNRDRKQREKNEEYRREQYIKYLGNIRKEITKASTIQKEILGENYPGILTQLVTPGFYEKTLWSKVFGQPDFLTLRIGTGNVPLQAELRFPEDRFSIVDDVLRDEVNKFSDEKKILEGVPVTYSLLENRVSGVTGTAAGVENVLNNMLLQIAALHSYDEVKIVFLCEEKDLYKYNYTRWMQHCWDNDGKTRYLATNQDEVRELSIRFSKIFETRREEKAKGFPHFVVISASKSLSDKAAFISELLDDDTIVGFSYLAAYDDMSNLPKECSIVVQVNDTQGTLYDKRTTTGENIVFVQDHVTSTDAENNVKNIADYHLDLNSGKYALPGMISFMDMFGAGKIEHLNIANRWKENNPVATLAAPIGVDEDGNTFMLDLHEKAHGPHGLVAGMTGSGKSEFIITYILSMAVNFHPDEVAFILIDYKGGGLTGAFESDQYRLPHLSGTITNLDGGSITRSLLSIQSELRRRQAVFNEARRISGEGTMDIYKYQKLRRNGVVEEAVPHLFIISDEFAELKSQQPEFMDQLISTARIGRSLGVHLILATQKPNGVVNDQIWANSKFKVCLKVQDKADSMDMLKRPDAAELVETGRFYLQVGYNELFELGQSAWAGAPYVPTDKVEKAVDDKVEMIGHLGNVIEEAKPKKAIKESKSAGKQIVEIMKYIDQIAKEENAFAKPLWLPEIPAMITVDAIRNKYKYNSKSKFVLDAVIGEYDDPFNQKQHILNLNLAESGNTVAYGITGFGKTTFCTALLYSLYEEHTSETLNAYILDFGAETLRMFAKAPQTGDFVISGDDEKVTNLVKYLKKESERRKKLFTEYGGDYASYCRNSGNVIPNILVVINNYPNFAEQYDALDEQLVPIARECNKFGIYFVVTSPASNGIRHKMQQNFTKVFVMQQNDKTDYISLIGSTGGVYPAKILGRGVFKIKDAYEFQVAHVIEDVDHTADFIKDFCRLQSETGMAEAKPIPVMPKVVRESSFSGRGLSLEKLPVGIDGVNFEHLYVNLKEQPVFPIYAMDKIDAGFYAESLVNLMINNSSEEIYLIDPENELNVSGIDAEHRITDNINDIIVKLFNITVARHNEYKLTDGHPAPDFDMHPILVFINGYGTMRQLTIEDDFRSKLRLMMEKTTGNLNLCYVIIDDYSASVAYCAEGWNCGNGLWIGNGVKEQMRFKFNKSTVSVTKSVDFTQGYYIKMGKALPVKVLVPDAVSVEEEENE